MFLLDTDHIGILQRRGEPGYARLWERVQAHPPDAFFVSIVSFHEQVLGWTAYLNQAKDAAAVVRAYGMFERVLDAFASAQVLSFDAEAAELFASFRAQRVRVATMDLRIAATAITRRLVVLTRNLADFRRVPGLHAEDWTV